MVVTVSYGGFNLTGDCDRATMLINSEILYCVSTVTELIVGRPGNTL